MCKICYCDLSCTVVILIVGIVLVCLGNGKVSYVQCNLIEITSKECTDREGWSSLVLTAIVEINQTKIISQGVDTCGISCRGCYCNYIPYHSYYCYDSDKILMMNCVKPSMFKEFITYIGATLIILAIATAILSVYNRYGDWFQNQKEFNDEKIMLTNMK